MNKNVNYAYQYLSRTERIYFILNSELKEELTEFYKTTCKKNDIPVIELHDIDKRNGHPTIKGMEQLKNQVFDFIKADFEN
ncbi:MAG: hypothetical protein IJC09_06655 [Clostridia bacterium]|nr:hypothetical protein [Clostridia bacterium]